ncbi:MAG TPA: FtsW/RodA/SpoVE family cell cycle protein [Phycisphaerae bacterium]|jgi:rod shape determining protein RodA
MNLRAFRKILLRVLTTRAAWPILISVGLLCTFSLLALELASPERADKQRMWLLLGAGVVLVSLLPHYNLIGRLAYAFYGLTIFLLLAVFLAPQVAYTHRWFVLPGGTLFQPSELAKISFVLVLAWHLRRAKNINTLEGLLFPFALAIIPFMLVLAEPDLGTALLFPLVLYAMLLAAGARMRHLLAIAAIALFAMPGAYPFLQPYQQKRIKSVLTVVMNKDSETLETLRTGDYHQQYQSQVAHGSGGAFGQGPQGVLPFRKGLLPEAYTDFIYSVIGAEWGFAGCVLVLLLYLGFLIASLEIAATARDNFAKFLVVGLACTILFQTMMNLNMTLGPPMPVVGVALPFVSYGGSSLLTSLLAAGLLLNVSVRRSPLS